jgi:hypothetical protein
VALLHRCHETIRPGVDGSDDRDDRLPPTTAVADAVRTRKGSLGKQVISDSRAMRGFGARFETQNMHDKSCRNG